MQSNTSHGTSMSNNVSQSATIARTNTNNAFHVPTTSAPFHPKAGSSGAHHATSSNNTSSTLHPNGPNSPHPQHLANNGTNYYLPPGSLSSPLGGAQYYQQQPHQQWPTEAPRHISHQQHHSNNNNNYQSNQNFLASQSPFTAADSPAKGSAESAGPQNNYTTAQFSMNHPDQRSPHHGLAARQYIDDGRPHSGHIRRAGDPSAPSPPFSFDDQTTSFGSPSSAHEVIQHRTHDTLHHHQHAMADTRLPSYYTQDSSDNNGRNLDHRGHHHHQLYNSSHQHQGMPQRGGSGNFTGGSHDFPHGGPQYASVQGKPHYASGDGDGRYGHNNNSNNNNIAHVVSPLNHTNQRGFDLSEGSPSAGSPILIPNTSRSDGPNQRIAIAKEERVAVGQGNVAQRHVNNDVSSPVDANTNSFQPPARMNSFEAALRAPSHRGVTLPAPPPPPRVPTGPVETPSYVAGNHNNNEDDDDDDDCELDAFNTLHAIDMAQGEEDMMED